MILLEGNSALLILLCLLQVKHMLGDYFFQTKIMLDGRDQYVHMGRVLHAGIHAAGSLIAFAIVGAPFALIIPMVIVEWIVHFHIDYWKGQHTFRQKLTPADAKYWRATGVDQALHQLTYVAMVAVWMVTTST